VAAAAVEAVVMRNHVYLHLVVVVAAVAVKQVSYHFVVVVEEERVVKMVTCYLVAPAVVLLGVHLAQLPTQMNPKG
jgi:hypothetical protein